MKILAFDTSTETLSIAVGRGLGAAGVGQVWSRSGPGGALASSQLIPAILALLAEAGLTLRELDAIAFGRGPGSFTGLRTACAVAQGLACGAAVPALPMDTLLAVADEARHRHGALQVVAALDARMDEVYTASYDFTLANNGGLPKTVTLVAPERLAVPAGWALAGNVGGPYAGRLPGGVVCLPALPTAEAMLRLAPGLIAAGQTLPADQALPLYLRYKVALTTAERQAKASAAAPVVTQAVAP